MKTFRFPILILCIATTLGLFTPQIRADEQPKMDAALDLLREAKKSEQPLPLLKEARTKLQNAARNKGGHRVEAIQLINDAIDLEKAGSHEKAMQKVDHAISMVHAGHDVGRR